LPEEGASYLQEGLVAEDAVEGGAADGELTGGAEFVAAIEVEDVLDVIANDGVEGEIVWLACGQLVGMDVGFEGQGEVAGEDDTVVGLQEFSFKDA
jgi:hypothetical protein